LRDVCRNPIRFAALDRPGNPVRIRLGSTVVRVEHEGGVPYKSDYVTIVYTRDKKLYRLRARAAVMAGGGWVTKHVVRDLPGELHAAYDHFHYAAMLRANIAVRNWRFLYRLGISGGAWFEGFGTGTSVLKAVTYGADSNTVGPDSPAALTLDHPFIYPGLPIGAQVVKGRIELLSTSFQSYERQIRETLSERFSRSGLDPRRDIAGIVLNRWGHALLAPQPGFFFGKDGKPAPRDLLRAKPFGRIAFAHTDLGGASSHVFAIREAQRAAEQILGLVYSV
jgi:spermidine dehydrogenase